MKNTEDLKGVRDKNAEDLENIKEEKIEDLKGVEDKNMRDLKGIRGENTEDLEIAEALKSGKIGDVFPRNDLVFKRILGDKRNGNILRDFLKNSLNLDDDDLSKIEIIESSSRANKSHDKIGILDVKCTTKTGKIIGIEIQVANDPSMKERLVYRNARCFADQIYSGESYFKLKKVITIAISIEHIIVTGGKDYKYCFDFYDKIRNICFTDISEIHIFEARNLPKEYENGLTQWLGFLKSESLEEMEMIASKNSAIKEAVCVYKELTADEAFRIEAWDRQMAIWDRKSQINNAKAEGIVEGEQIGIKKGEKKRDIEVARNSLKEGFTPEQISKITGLTIDQIKSLMQ
ncbi:MAG: Rpn family recombination-promoting nuclease/putative transposase [Oscillospiraceae bacterium]|nr:Rpn family recombination-promoting nuclease/putative transposase [Oscillospiraceae bacterium]